MTSDVNRGPVIHSDVPYNNILCGVMLETAAERAHVRIPAEETKVEANTLINITKSAPQGQIKRVIINQNCLNMRKCQLSILTDANRRLII